MIPCPVTDAGSTMFTHPQHILCRAHLNPLVPKAAPYIARRQLGRFFSLYDLHSRLSLDRLSQSSHWNDIGALKRELIGMWIGERNAFVERVVKDMNEQRRIRQLSQPPVRTRYPVLAQ